MKIPKSVEIFGLAVLPTLGVILISFFAVPFGISQVTGIRGKISQEGVNQNVLSQKLDTLTTVGEAASAQSSIVTIAVPDSNPALITLSQMRTLAVANGLAISGVKGGAETKDKSGLSRVDISFDVNGPRPQIFAFLAAVNNISPITVVSKIKMNESGGNALANVTVRSFWSSFPTKLPAVTEPESGLTADEKSTVTKVSALKQPIFSEVPASDVLGRSDPFSP